MFYYLSSKLISRYRRPFGCNGIIWFTTRIMFVVDSRISLLAACPTVKNSKNPTRKIGISASKFCSFSSLANFSLSRFKFFLKRYFGDQNKLLNFAGHAMKYGAVNGLIIAHVLPERCNKHRLNVNPSLIFFFSLHRVIHPATSMKTPQITKNQILIVKKVLVLFSIELIKFILSFDVDTDIEQS